ncbi:MAG TPA: LuxR C-terminal-related transcriptional regulator [Streptosporangiaceae bacterium]
MPLVANTAELPPAASPGQADWAGDPLLVSKITVPGRPGWLVPRPRLDRLIASGTRVPVTTVTGPPGAGKTMALALWAAGRPPAAPIAWVTIDDFDNRPRVFWSYVLAALGRAGVPVPRTLSATARRYSVDHEFLLRLAVLLAAQDPPVTLVLDDLHLLTSDKVLNGLAYVLRHAGPGLRLVVSSRMDPLLPLHRYRLTSELAEIRAGDLAFTVAESRLLMAQHGIILSAESLERLTRRAEGWAAVMRLAAISMAGHDDPDQFVKELVAEDSAVTGYLVDEVLNAQPPHVQDFLLRTSILDRVSEEVADELMGGGQAAAVLPELLRTNTLVQRDDSGWYRYHSLFAAVLRLKLRREAPDRVRDLHLRAAGWYRRNGSVADAVRHAARAGDWLVAARAVIDGLAVGQLIEGGGDGPLADGFRHLPRDLRWTEPQPLLVAAALDVASGPDGRGEPFLTAADQILAQRPAADEIPSRLAASLVRLTVASRTGDSGAAAAAADQAGNLVKALPSGQSAWRQAIEAQVLAGRGAMALWAGRFDEAAAMLRAGAATGRAPDGDRGRAACLGLLALLEAMQGRLGHAAELAAEALGRPDGDAARPAGPIRPAAEVALAAVYTERNELARARRWEKRAHEALQGRPDKLMEAVACLVAARRCLAEGRARAAREYADRARRQWAPPAWLARQLTLLDAWAGTAAGDFPAAIAAARQAGPESSLDAAVALARALLAAGNRQAAAHTLAVAPGEEAPDAARLAAWLANAQLGYLTGDRARGRQSLERALRLAMPEQVRLPFAIERSWLRPVLRRDPELASPYHRLLEPDLVSTGLLRMQPPAGQAAPLIVEPLSEREREVLEHVSAMESTAEIATEMYISVNTVKTHLKSIYRKLAVGHRGEAVRRAKQAGLL